MEKLCYNNRIYNCNFMPKNSLNVVFNFHFYTSKIYDK